jgi:DNA-binding NtrC family response regulator
LIYVVDDDANMCTIIRATLLESGFRVTTASDAEAAISQLKAIAPDLSLLILDLVMPGVKGTDLVERIRHLYPKLPIVISTGGKLSATDAVRLDQLVQGITYKPFTVSALRTVIGRALEDFDIVPVESDAI